MSRRALLALCPVVLAGCDDKPPPVPDSARFTSATGVLPSEKSKWVVSRTGIGRVRFGMTLKALGDALGDPSIAAMPSTGSCTYIRPKALPSGVSLMVSNGVVVRADIDSTGILTEAGIGVGDSEVEVLVINSGRVRVETSKYSGPLLPAHTLTVTDPDDADHLIIFETDGSRVRNFRAGLRSAAEQVERCG